MSFTEEQIKATALASLGWWHHSIHNTIDKVEKDKLALHLRVYANWMWGLLSQPVLPYEYEPVASRFVDRLSEFATLDIPGIDMAGAVERARDFQMRAANLDATSKRWREQGTASDDLNQAAKILNGAMIGLSRTLVPIASTVVGPYGQDRYGHAWQTQMIPSLVPYPDLARYDRDSEEYQTWWVAMVRARNRVSDALDRAIDITDHALGTIGT
jgi:hypothetical protein